MSDNRPHFQKPRQKPGFSYDNGHYNKTNTRLPGLPRPHTMAFSQLPSYLRERRPTMPLNSRLKPDMMLFLSRTLSELHQPSSRRKIPGSCFPATGISVCFSLSAGFSGKSGTAFPRPGFQQRPDVVVGNIGAVQTQQPSSAVKIKSVSAAEKLFRAARIQDGAGIRRAWPSCKPAGRGNRLSAHRQPRRRKGAG